MARGTYKEEDLDRVRAADGDEVGGIVLVAGADNKDLCSVRVADVHLWAKGGSRTVEEESRREQTETRETRTRRARARGGERVWTCLEASGSEGACRAPSARGRGLRSAFIDRKSVV